MHVKFFFRAGLSHRDIIIEVNGKILKSSKDIAEALAKNLEVEFTVLRANSKIKLKVKAEEISN